MKSYYDSIAKGYNKLYKEEQLCKWELVKDLILFEGLTLDAGCGTGFITEKLPNVIGVDSSKKMLSECSKKVRTVHASLTKLPFEDDYFDNIVSISVLQDVKDYKKVISEFKRVLKPGGKLLITVLDKENIKPIRIELKNEFKGLKEKKVGKDVAFFT